MNESPMTAQISLPARAPLKFSGATTEISLMESNVPIHADRH